jgi:predicted site-specific integrase-resolvase
MLYKAERRSRKYSPRNSQRILPFKDWCALNGFSEATGRRIIAAGKVRVTQLSERRIGVGEEDNADFQARCARGPP